MARRTDAPTLRTEPRKVLRPSAPQVSPHAHSGSPDAEPGARAPSAVVVQSGDPAASRFTADDIEEMIKVLAERLILIAYDSSEGARRAIAVAGDLFPGRKAIVLHVWSPVSLIVASYGGMAAIPACDDDAFQDSAGKLAEEGCALAREAGLRAQPEIAELTSFGQWHTILDVAAQYDAELVVLGARGLSTFKSLVLGSVSHSVAQHAHIPVLVVPPADMPERPAVTAGSTRHATVGA